MLSRRTAWRIFSLAVVFSVLAMLVSISCRSMFQLTNIMPPLHSSVPLLLNDSHNLSMERTLQNTISSIVMAPFNDAITNNTTTTTTTIENTVVKTTNNSKTTTQMVATTNLTHEYDKKVFVMDAYLVGDRQIRITSIRRCKSRKRLIVHLRFNLTSFSLPTNNQPIQNCPWWFASKCTFVGYFINVYLPKAIMPPLLNTSMPQAYIGTDENGKDIRYPLRLHDARAKQPNRKHQLAVCLQPIFLLADWTILIQFFETWIVQGATKFYIYVHSIAPEVDALLKLYEADRKIDVERVHWAPLPVRNGTSPNDDPNFLIYRTEVVTSVNDCVLRSRGHTKYVVSSDLDEIIVPFRNLSLIALVDALKLGTPKAAAFIFLSSYALFQNDWAKAESPKAINFEKFSEVELEEYVWPNGKRSKVIMIPELIRSAHVHTVLHTEKSTKIVVVSRKDALVFHLRRVLKRDKLSTNETRPSNDLQRFVKPCNDLWNQRLKQIPQVPGTEILRQAKWPNRGLKVMEELEECLVAEFARRSEMCTSPLKCINAIQAIQPKQWVWANQTWTVL